MYQDTKINFYFISLQVEELEILYVSQQKFYFIEDLDIPHANHLMVFIFLCT